VGETLAYGIPLLIMASIPNSATMGGGVYGVVLVSTELGVKLKRAQDCGYQFCIETPEANQNYISVRGADQRTNGVVVQ
jgi:hypothetical protein